ncbi:MAG TPA: TldD/PmbA family protein [Nitrospiria bacterium]|nr:TldD/PmbA family protein [Nitrospiria bacterium]
MTDLAAYALDVVTGLGAVYADVRLIVSREQAVVTRNGDVATLVDAESAGIGIRVIVNDTNGRSAGGGAWGFSATSELTRPAVEAAAREAVAVAMASTLAQRTTLALAPQEPIVADWSSPVQRDPFKVGLDEKIALLLRADTAMRRVNGVSLARGYLTFTHVDKTFLSSAGARIRQRLIYSGAGCDATSFMEGEIQKRSYPNSFGGQHQLKGYELIDELDLPAHAERVGEESVALHRAAQCPSKTTTLILDSSQLGLQIHESIGHAIELDRMLGYEANYAGTSFLAPAMLNRFEYGSPVVNVVADATLAHGPGLGTFRYDDEGVPAQSVPIITAGRLTGLLTSRETAPSIGLGASGGAMRADGWNRIPLIRMTNVSLLPDPRGPSTLDELIAGTDDGVYLETNRSWSIDDRRLHFQFGTEIGWEIKKGRRARMLKNPSYGGVTPPFWRSCDAICGQDAWTLWGTPNCGKGQPPQTIGTGHGASPARFRNVDVGVAYEAADQA